MNEPGSVPSPVPAGWYADPWRRAEWRWWDGLAWTPAVAAQGRTWWDAPVWGLQVPTTGWSPQASTTRSDPTTLPFAAVGLAVGGLVAGFIGASVAASVLVFGLGLGSSSPAVTVANLLALWTGLLGATVIASRQYGSGHLGPDLGLSWKWMDALRGVGANITARVATSLVAIPLVAAGAAASNTSIIQNQKTSTLGLIVVGASAVVGAPIVEEMFFRGLLLRSLASKLGWGWAIAVQGVVFGLAHANPALGWRTFTVVAVTATFGMSQGFFARRWSLGPLMVSHALFNLLPVLIIALR